MKHSFTITKRMEAWLPLVIANYLDLEHIPVHSGLRGCEVLAESASTACFTLTSQVGPFAVRNVHYFEFRAPCEILHIVKTPLGPMRVVSTAREVPGADPVCTEVVVQVEIDLPAWVYPLRGVVERILRHLNRVVLDEDMTILARRQRIFGDFIEDFLRPRQRILFKELFREHYSREAPSRRISESAQAPPDPHGAAARTAG